MSKPLSPRTSIGLMLAAWMVALGLSFGGFPATAQDVTKPADSTAQEPAAPAKTRGPRSKSATPRSNRRGMDRPAADSSKEPKAGAGAKPTDGEKGKGSPAGNGPAGSGISFRHDIAPILVANCVGCHSQNRPGLVRGKLDLTSFAKLMQGTPKEKVLAPGNPDESHLVLRIKGDEQPRMPQGGNNNALSEQAIGKIEQWIKAGAILDAGLDPKAGMDSYAATPEEIRRDGLARLSVKERDQKTEAAGRSRWKQANPRLNPELISGEHFLLLSNLPKDRAANTVRLMETQHSQMKRVLGPAATDWVENVGLYVFSDRKDFVEFVRTVENRELEAGVLATGNLAGPDPYLAAVDPQGGKKDEPAATRRARPRTRKGDDREAAAVPNRTLVGLLAESLGESVVAAQGKPPRWLSHGVGAFLGSQVEPRSPYYQKLRGQAFEMYRKGWTTLAAEALADSDQVSADDIRAVGFAVVDSVLRNSGLRASFPSFAQGLSKGKEKLDDVLKEVFQASREDFLTTTGDWVAGHYGHDQ